MILRHPVIPRVIFVLYFVFLQSNRLSKKKYMQIKYITHVHRPCRYGVATISRLLKITGLFCRIQSLLQGSFAKETCNFKEPTNRSHPTSPKKCRMSPRHHPINDSLCGIWWIYFEQSARLCKKNDMYIYLCTNVSIANHPMSDSLCDI